MQTLAPGRVIARQDRIPIWSLPGLFVWVIGIGFLFTFFDTFDISVSFIQTCAQIVPGCSPENAATFIGLPTLLSLIGYLVGTLVLSPLSDSFGRRDMLLVTMALTGIGSLWTGFTFDYTQFNAARFITGLGIGADLAIVNTYINEMAPRAQRGQHTALIFIMSSLGAFFGIWLGLWLTTPATGWPLGLPFAIAGPAFSAGWRVMYWVGALLALVGVLLRFQLPESPRWLISRARLKEADEVVSSMIGGVVLAFAGTTLWLSFLGSIVLFAGFNMWVPMTYSWSTENFPARARTTGFALVDGVGHVGGGIGLLLIALLIPHLGAMLSMILIAGFLWIGAAIAQFGTPTRNRQLEVISP